MYSRNIKIDSNSSFFLFGPRGTGKSYWLKKNYEQCVYIDLLEAQIFTRLLADPGRLESFIPSEYEDWIIIDEIQKIPALLDEIHRLIELKKYKFILTGFSPRKLKRALVNLLGGRAFKYHFFPLTAVELGDDFDLKKALNWGLLPTIYDRTKKTDPKKYLESYVEIYLREEVFQEGLTRNLAAFSRFLEAASFSQGQVLNVSEISRECSVHRKVVENYFNILEDLLIGIRIPVFTKKAKRRLIKHNKFYFFDTGVFRAIRPKGILDTPELIDGAAIETLVLQEIRAFIANLNLSYKIFYWRTSTDIEVDFVFYGEAGFAAVEIKRKKNITQKDIRGLSAFKKDYPMASLYLIYGGDRTIYMDGITIIPISSVLKNPGKILR